MIKADFFLPKKYSGGLFHVANIETFFGWLIYLILSRGVWYGT